MSHNRFVLPTVAINHEGSRRVINASEFDPALHVEWREEEEKKEADKSLEPAAIDAKPAKKKASKE